MKPAVLLSTLIASWNLVSAFRLPLHGKRQSLERRRTSFIGTSVLGDSSGVEYSTNITLGGLQFSVLVDTGSADLFVVSARDIPDATATEASTSIVYASGAVTGPIRSAALEFSGHSVPNQAFMFVSPDQTHKDGTGRIGLGPSFTSAVLGTLSAPAGNTPLDNIFLQDSTTPNFISILLGRADEPGSPFPGDLTVGEILPGYDSISSQPQLDVTVVPFSDSRNQHWQILLDKDGIIGPNGQPIPVASEVQTSIDPKQLTAILDSSFSLPQVPKIVADGFYSSFEGAEFVNISGAGEVWTLPCNQEVNITFNIGGQPYSIHPLDAVMDPADLGIPPVKNSKGDHVCIGSFQPYFFRPGSYDIILGMAFLRNTYVLLNFGDFIQGTPNRASPYIQFLSTTNDTSKAHTDFVAVRGNGSSKTTVSGGNNKRPNFFTAHARLIYIIGGSVMGVIILGLVAAFVFRKRNKKRKVKQLKMVFSPSSSFGTYSPLDAPAPVPDTDLYLPPPSRAGWEPHYNYQQDNEPLVPSPVPLGWEPHYNYQRGTEPLIPNRF